MKPQLTPVDLHVRLSPASCPPLDPCPQTRLVEFGSAAIALWWALLLLLPVHLFKTNPSFDFLPRVGPEWQWGLGCLLVGGWQLVAALRRHLLSRWAGACLSAGLWSGIAACLAEGCRWQHHLPINTGFGAYGVLFALGYTCAAMLAPYMLADVSVWAGRLWRHWKECLHRWADKRSGG